MSGSTKYSGRNGLAGKAGGSHRLRGDEHSNMNHSGARTRKCGPRLFLRIVLHPDVSGLSIVCVGRAVKMGNRLLSAGFGLYNGGRILPGRMAF